MLRITIELLPQGNEKAARTIGLIEIANDGSGTKQTGNYRCTLKKTFPWRGALVEKWKQGVFTATEEDKDVLAGTMEGFDRQKRGPYDLLFRALVACGIDRRNMGGKGGDK